MKSFGLLSLVSLAGLAASSLAPTETPRGATAPEVGAERELIDADLAFAADARVRGVAVAFAERYHPEGKLISPGASVIIGPEAVRAALANDRSTWVWAPEEAAASGDLGVTWGHATITTPEADGDGVSIHTRYVTVWRRDPQRRWKIWIDIGNRGPARR